MKNQKCPFCNLNKERNRIIEGKTHVFITPSNPRLMPNHLLVIPKRHVKKISQLSEEEQKELFKTTIEIQEKILSKIARGCDIRQNHRPFQKEDSLKVNHLHIHLQPRELFDNLYHKCQIFEKDIFKELTKGEIDQTVKLFSE